MSRFIVAAVSCAAAVEAWGDAIAAPTVSGFGVAGFVLLRTAVLAAVSVCVFTRGEPRRHSREPLAFGACAVALTSIPLLEKPSATAETSFVVAGDLIALAAWVWLLVSFLALGRCFGLLPEARGLVTRGPYRLADPAECPARGRVPRGAGDPDAARGARADAGIPGVLGIRSPDAAPRSTASAPGRSSSRGRRRLPCARADRVTDRRERGEGDARDAVARLAGLGGPDGRRALVRMVTGARRRAVRVPDRRRLRHERAGARSRPGQVLHEEHAGDDQEVPAGSNVLVAGPRGDREGRRLRMDRAACVHQGPSRPTAAVSGRRRAGLLSRHAPEARLASGRPGREVPGHDRGGSGARNGDRRQGRRDVREHLHADRRSRSRDLLLERDARRRTRKSREPVGRVLVHMGVAVENRREGGRPRRRTGGLRPAVRLGPGSGRRTLRARGQSLSGLRARVESLLRGVDDRNVLLTDERAQGQPVLLADAGDRRRPERGGLERGAGVREA